ncbi:transketolase family protein [Ruminococcaceae bacterium OttesenSCG-928-L11]|nr:transketolase family protein [Ruminococcaceae bacterium OttesenSCG-928-L11]
MEQIPPRDGYGKGLLRLCAEDSRVIVLDADVAKSTRTIWVREQYPKSFLDMGISEQDMVGTAAGLAMTGMLPFASTYSAFLTGRAYDQIRAVCHDNLNVKLAGAHAGFSTGPDGSIHQALEDIAAMRALPNMTVIVPCDAVQVEKAVLAVRDWQGPCYLRFGREPLPVVSGEGDPFHIGKARILRDGSDVTILANGAMVYEAMQAADLLQSQGLSALVADMHTVKPLDVSFVQGAARTTGAIVTAEEHQIAGGLGGAVAECVCETYPVPVLRIGVRDTFGESGSPDDLMRRYGLTAKAIAEAAQTAYRMKR